MRSGATYLFLASTCRTHLLYFLIPHLHFPHPILQSSRELFVLPPLASASSSSRRPGLGLLLLASFLSLLRGRCRHQALPVCHQASASSRPPASICYYPSLTRPSAAARIGLLLLTADDAAKRPTRRRL
ncbi:hypothetical protein BRADI_1g57715v3 [Brachypodium distachyon]|uniref:Uncharacterized protein n=1 Tax=Brachypodium distachyon TaxID=15368 RepID=A0A0Q3NTY5_BRADI|nr:hypothetical protein BRADI_1g57715v3 [Brachypodium distachyon]